MSIYKKNNKYYCRFQLNGERKHLLCAGATSEKEAKLIETQFMFKMQQQHNGIVKKDKVKLEKLYKNYSEYAKLNKKSWQEDLQRLNKVKEIWKHKTYAEDVKSSDIEYLKRVLLQTGISKITVNRYLEILSKMFNLAVDEDWLYRNPIKKHTKFPVKNYQLRILYDYEKEQLFNVADEVWADMITVALNTGLRQSNIRLLQGKHVRLDFRIIELTENKGNKHIKLPLNNKMYEFFKEKKIKSDEYYFLDPKTGLPYNRRTFNKVWNRLKKSAGVNTDLRFHDLRHTVGTTLAKEGVPIHVIRDILAHSDIKTTMQYIHNSSEQMRAAVNVLDSYN